MIRDHHEPIIDRELWDIVQVELKKRDRNGILGEGHSNRYVFSGKIKCGECGASFVSRQKKRKDGTSYKRWGCFTATTEGRVHEDVQGNQVGCDVGKMLRDELAMDMLKQSLASLQMDVEGIIRSVTDLAVDAIRAGEEQLGDRPEVLEHQIELLSKKKADVLDAFFSRQITKDEMKLVNERYDRELEELRGKLAAARSKEGITYETEELKKDVRERVTALLNGETNSEIFYKNVLDHMVVYRDRRVEVCLNLLPQKWIFILENLREINRKLEENVPEGGGVCNNDPSVLPELGVNSKSANPDEIEGSGSVCQFDPDVPISVSRPLVSAKGMA